MIVPLVYNMKNECNVMGAYKDSPLDKCAARRRIQLVMFFTSKNHTYDDFRCNIYLSTVTFGYDFTYNLIAIYVASSKDTTGNRASPRMYSSVES